MTLRRFFLTFNKKNDKQKYLVPLFCPFGYLIFDLIFFNKKSVFRFSVSLGRKAVSIGNFFLVIGGIFVANLLFFLLKLSIILLNVATIISWSPGDGEGCCRELDGEHPFAFGDSEKKRTFFSERDKKLTNFYRVPGNMDVLFFGLWISTIFFCGSAKEVAPERFGVFMPALYLVSIHWKLC